MLIRLFKMETIERLKAEHRGSTMNVSRQVVSSLSTVPGNWNNNPTAMDKDAQEPLVKKTVI